MILRFYDWRKANTSPIFQKGEKEELGNHKLISISWIPEKVLEQLRQETVSRHVKDKRGIRSSRHGFTKGKSCLRKPAAFYHERTDLVGEGKEVDMVYPDFSKAFDIVFLKVLLEKLLKYGLAEQIGSWIDKWLHGRAQRVVIHGTKPCGRLLTSGHPYVLGAAWLALV